MTTDRSADRVCACCARPAVGIGVAPPNVKSLSQILWLCDDPECIQIGNLTVGMKQIEFGRVDAMATQEAGEAVEAYCDEVGKTDLRDLTQVEWDMLCRRFVGAYRDALQTKLRHEAPF